MVKALSLLVLVSSQFASAALPSNPWTDFSKIVCHSKSRHSKIFLDPKAETMLPKKYDRNDQPGASFMFSSEGREEPVVLKFENGRFITVESDDCVNPDAYRKCEAGYTYQMVPKGEPDSKGRFTATFVAEDTFFNRETNVGGVPTTYIPMSCKGHR